MARRTNNRKHSPNRVGLATLTTLVFSSLVGWSVFAQSKPAVKPKAALTDATMQARFEKQVWPLLTRSAANCVACHGKDNPSQLHFPDGAANSYHQMLTEGRLDAHNPASLLARVTATGPGKMPPAPMPGWSAADIKILRDYVTDSMQTRALVADKGPKSDEVFPASLLSASKSPGLREGEDNTFLTYFQLRRKVVAVFGDDWKRGDKNLFADNVAQFNGADFVSRFDESNRPTASYLSAASEMASDLASRAYLNKTGPFAGRPAVLPATGAAAAAQVKKLYQTMLFRDPTPGEAQAAAKLLQSVYGKSAKVAAQTGALTFALEARDEAGQKAVREVRLETLPANLGMTENFINESLPETERQTLGTFTLKPGAAGQRLEIGNLGTVGRVSFKSVTVRGPLPAKTETVIASNAPTVQVEGAWRGFGENAKDGYEDSDANKGKSVIRVPLSVAKPGKYEVDVAWVRAEGDAPAPPAGAKGRRRRGASGSADSVPVAVYSSDPSKIALPELSPTPPRGQAQFAVDQTVDTIRYWDSGIAFQFAGAKPGVQISNAGTKGTVVADAVSYVPAATPDVKPSTFISVENAVGHEGWRLQKADQGFADGGKLLAKQQATDDAKKKGELSLLFAPGKDVTPTVYYRARFSFPGRVDNDPRVPVTIFAAKSTPIVRLRAPVQAPIGAGVTLDAGSSYNVQRTPLKFTWTQIGGPAVMLSDPHAAVVKLVVPRLSAQQAAWEGLCRALVLHPDFLFTRPRSLQIVKDSTVRRRLQLVKIAQDLVARPPTQAEFTLAEKSKSVVPVVNKYLASEEFEEFYARRVRLYMESHGTPEQDEPVRLWKYILHTNRPYQEILTADYTLTPAGKKEQRPDYAGHTGILTMKGFIDGKQGLPHFNYAAQVCEKFLSYVFEVPAEVLKIRGTQTAASTVDPKSMCYSCHQVLTPLAYQRTRWTDDGKYTLQEADGSAIDDSDRASVPSYPYKGGGMEAFARQAQNKERFHRAIIQTHFVWYFGREMRYDTDERDLYKRLWETTHKTNYALRPLIRTLVTSPEYLGDALTPKKSTPSVYRNRTAHR